MTLVEPHSDLSANPVDVIEMVAARNDWTFDRATDDEITVSIEGSYADYSVAFSWMEEMEALHVACAFDFRIAEARKTEVTRLLALVNEQMWIGHFDLWQDEGVVMYRNALLLAGQAGASDEQVAALIENAVEACEQFHQAFQFVIWGGKSAREALDQSLMETVGTA